MTLLHELITLRRDDDQPDTSETDTAFAADDMSGSGVCPHCGQEPCTCDDMADEHGEEMDEPQHQEDASQNPHEEGTPEHEAWEAGFQAGLESEDTEERDDNYDQRGAAGAPVSTLQADGEQGRNSDTDNPYVAIAAREPESFSSFVGREEEEVDPYSQGAEAFHRGASRKNNPHLSSSEKHKQWRSGYHAAHAKEIEHNRSTGTRVGSENEETNAIDQGYDAYEHGLGRDANPYERGTPDYNDWLDAWTDARINRQHGVGVEDEQLTPQEHGTDDNDEMTIARAYDKILKKGVSAPVAQKRIMQWYGLHNFDYIENLHNRLLKGNEENEEMSYEEQDARYGRHIHCPDENHRCFFGDEDKCPKINDVYDAENKEEEERSSIDHSIVMKGERAFHRGDNETNNPYEQGTSKSDDWLEGFRRAGEEASHRNASYWTGPRHEEDEEGGIDLETECPRCGYEPFREGEMECPRCGYGPRRPRRHEEDEEGGIDGARGNATSGAPVDSFQQEQPQGDASDSNNMGPADRRGDQEPSQDKPAEENPELDQIANKASEDPDHQGLIRKVPNGHLVYKRQTDEGNYQELWVYNAGALKDSLEVRKAILAGTDIPVGKSRSPDGTQEYEIWTAGNVEMILIKGLPN